MKTNKGVWRDYRYNCWKNMLGRCFNPRHPCYERYGGRGITVCDKWKNSSREFFKDMGPRPPGMWLDRVDNDGDYTPENCRWATPRQQHNNKSTNNLIFYKGETKTAAQWARSVGINYRTFNTRLFRGWSVARALTQPTGAGRVQKD